MRSMPEDKAFDSTFALLKQGYRFISNRCNQLDSNVFKTRLLFQDVICMKGEEAAILFYDNDKFVRHGAMPARAQKTLVGIGGVQGLDGSAHTHRKSLFLNLLMAPARIEKLVEINQAHWQAAIASWSERKEIVLFEEAQNILCKSVCEWAGVPIADSDIPKRASEFGLMIDSGAKVGLHHWRGKAARKSSEKWITGLIKDARIQNINNNNETVLQAVALHADENGKLLPATTAAVELINILRPVVAIAQLAVFSAMALHQHPECRERLLNEDAEYLNWFVLEVRRFYPFFPFLAAQVRKDFTWQGYEFIEGKKVLLDIFGTNHDKLLWPIPDTFQPERFSNWGGSLYSFIPNGGGTYDRHHRCPGEWITNALMRSIINILAIPFYEVPPQDLSLSLRQIPAVPASGFIIRPLLTMREGTAAAPTVPN